MPASRYNFTDIFDHDQVNGILVPKFDIIVNGVRHANGVGITQIGLTGALNLFNYIGHDIAGTWDGTNLTIEGFY